MAMSGNDMGEAIRDALAAAGHIDVTDVAAMADALAKLEDFCNAMVAYIGTNMAYTVPVGAPGTGLQTTTAFGAATGPPAAPVTITGEIT